MTRSHAYDEVGNLLSVTDRNGRVREFTYDNLNRQIKEEWLSASSQVIHTIDSTYDVKGRLTNIADDDSEYTYTYDDLDRIITESNVGTPNLPNLVLTAAYDLAGRRTSLSASIGGVSNFTNTYEYDDLDRLKKVTQTGAIVSSKRVDFAYRADDSYDTITRYTDTAGTQLAASTGYGYDSAGRRETLPLRSALRLIVLGRKLDVILAVERRLEPRAATSCSTISPSLHSCLTLHRKVSTPTASFEVETKASLRRRP